MMKNSIGSGHDNGDDDDISTLPITVFGDEFIVCQILTRLPAKTLMRFKCVCKRWLVLIQDDPRFIDLHLSQSKIPTGPTRLLITAPMGDGGICLFSADLFESGAAVAHRTKTTLRGEPSLLKSVNGLICFGWVEGVTIYNPSTQEMTPLIKTTLTHLEERFFGDQREMSLVSQRLGYGFGFDPTTNQHKVICIWEKFKIFQMYKIIDVQQVCEVLTVGDNTWRMIDEVPPDLVAGKSIHVNGTIYWQINFHDSFDPKPPEILVAFDVGSEKFRVINVPDLSITLLPSTSYLSSIHLMNIYDLLEVGGRIAIIDKRSTIANADMIKMWIFDDDKGESSTNNWIEETITVPPFDWERDRIYHSFEAIAGTDLLIIKPYIPTDPFSLYYYDRKKKTSTKVEITGISSVSMVGTEVKKPQFFQITSFVESLLPVGVAPRDRSMSQGNGSLAEGQTVEFKIELGDDGIRTKAVDVTGSESSDGDFVQGGRGDSYGAGSGGGHCGNDGGYGYNGGGRRGGGRRGGRGRKNGACYNCGEAGHFSRECPQGSSGGGGGRGRNGGRVGGRGGGRNC